MYYSFSSMSGEEKRPNDTKAKKDDAVYYHNGHEITMHEFYLAYYKGT
jgi:hypothetical protein